MVLSFLSCKKINSDFLPRPNILWNAACVFRKILPRGYFASFILLLWRLVSQNNRKCYIERLHLVIPYMHEHFLVHYFSDTFEGERVGQIFLLQLRKRWGLSIFWGRKLYQAVFKLFLNYCVNIAVGRSRPE